MPVIGDDVRPGEQLHVRSLDPLTDGSLRVLANGQTLLDQHLPRGERDRVHRPGRAGLAARRAAPRQRPARADPLCGPIDLGANLCAYDAAMVAMTSPVYVR